MNSKFSLKSIHSLRISLFYVFLMSSVSSVLVKEQLTGKRLGTVNFTYVYRCILFPFVGNESNVERREPEQFLISHLVLRS